MGLLSNFLLDAGSAICDGLSWAEALLIRISTPMFSPTNEHGVLIHAIIEPSNATAAYEKDILQVWGICKDPSDFQKGILKEPVAIDARMVIDGNNPSGYGYGMYIDVGIRPGSDGELCGLEIGGRNFGSENPNYGTPLVKGLISCVAGEEEGARNFTHVFAVAPGTAKFFHGFIMERAAFPSGASVFEIIDNTSGKVIFAIKEDGTLRYSKLEQIA